MTLIAVSMPSRRRRLWWVEHLQSLLPDWTVCDAEDCPTTAEVTYAVVWKPPPGWLAEQPALKAIVSIGAGIDHILADPLCPTHLPIIKTSGTDLVQRMREFVALQVLRLHRELPALQAAQSCARWSPMILPPASGRRVGIMGLGTLGRACVDTLLGLGFRVCGWSHRGANIDGLRSHAGASELDAFLEDCEILVCLLPLTSDTQGILDARLFERLPTGAALINVARGQHLVEADLLMALDSGQLSQAALDVFAVEPLPADHPFWQHPAILVTPHVASLIDPISGGRIIADNIRHFDAHGCTARAADMADAGRGY